MNMMILTPAIQIMCKLFILFISIDAKLCMVSTIERSFRFLSAPLQLCDKLNLKGNGNIFFIFSFERTFRTIYNILLPFFHMLFTSTNILIERNENFCGYAFHVTTGGSRNIFI